MKINFVKSIFVIIMTFILIIVVQSKTKAAIYENTFEYELKSGAVVITKYIGNDNQVVIPEIISETTRMSIEKGAFESADLKKVVILNNVRKIEKGAFSENTKVVIYGKKDSIAEKYAKENNMEFRVYCDINGDNDVTATDSLKAKRHIVELSEHMLNEDEQIRADLNCDGNITTTDLLIIKKIIVGLDEREETEERNELDELNEPETTQAPEETQNPEVTETPEEYVTISYITDYREFPNYRKIYGEHDHMELWETSVMHSRDMAGHFPVNIIKDLPQKEYKVPKGTVITITTDKFEYESWHRVYEETGTEDYAKFTDEWIANKAPEIIEMDLSQKTLRGISLEDYTKYCTGRHILITRSKNKS